MSEITRIAKGVWELRKRVEHAWPTPPVDDALRFALCEAAEALDARLRENPAYARNHARNVNRDQELAQCAIMLITALGDEHRYGSIDFAARRDVDGLDEIVRFVANAFGEFVFSPHAPTWRIWAECALVQTARVLGFDALDRLVGRELAEIEARHLDATLRDAVAACQRIAGR